MGSHVVATDPEDSFLGDVHLSGSEGRVGDRPGGHMFVGADRHGSVSARPNVQLRLGQLGGTHCRQFCLATWVGVSGRVNRDKFRMKH